MKVVCDGNWESEIILRIEDGLNVDSNHDDKRDQRKREHETSLRNKIRNKRNEHRAENEPMIEPLMSRDKRIMIDFYFEEPRPDSHYRGSNPAKIDDPDIAPEYFGNGMFSSTLSERIESAMNVTRNFLFESDTQIVRVNAAQSWMQNRSTTGILNIRVTEVSGEAYGEYEEIVEYNYDWVYAVGKSKKRKLEDTKFERTVRGFASNEH